MVISAFSPVLIVNNASSHCKKERDNVLLVAMLFKQNQKTRQSSAHHFLAQLFAFAYVV